MPQIAPVRVERTVLAVAEIAGGHDAEGADGGERANLRAAQPHVAVSRPDALAFRAARQLEVAREHIARIEPLAFARIGQPAAAALAELATVIVAVAWVIIQRGSKSIDTSDWKSSCESAKRMAATWRRQSFQNVSKTPVECGGLAELSDDKKPASSWNSNT